MLALILISLATVIWALTHQRFRRAAISGPLVMVGLGAVAGVSLVGESVLFFDSKVALLVAEVVLALLLFTDAVDVKGPPLAALSSVPRRLLLVALPLSLVMTLTVGLLLPLGLSLPVVLAVACIATPVDFAPETSIVRDRTIPTRVRRWLNLESGYNDGLVTPLLLGALALSNNGSASRGEDALSTFVTAAPAGLIAVLVGSVVGISTGWLFRLARSSGWSDTQGARIGLLAIPILTFAVAQSVSGNGFVAAFVSGITFRFARGAKWDDHAEIPLLEDATHFLTLLLWFAFGIVSVVLVTSSFEWWPAFVLALFALTLGRMIPVLLALIGSRTTLRDRIFMAVLGPRGAASIVFGLIAFNTLQNEEGYAVLAATSIVILGSLLLHGVGGPFLISRVYGKRRKTATVSSPSRAAEH